MSGVTLASLVRSLHEVFPNAQVFLAGRDLLFVATQDGRPLDLRAVAARLAIGTGRGGPRPRRRAGAGRPRGAAPGGAVRPRQPTARGAAQRRRPAVRRVPGARSISTRCCRRSSPSPSSWSATSTRSRRSAGWTTGAPPIDLAIEVTHSLMAKGDLAGGNRWLAALIARDSIRSAAAHGRPAEATRRRDQENRLMLARRALEASDLDGARRVLADLLARIPAGRRP